MDLIQVQHKLRKDGWAIKTEHRRPIEGDDSQYEYPYRRKKNRGEVGGFDVRFQENSQPQTCGGTTVVTLTKNGKSFKGVSNCSYKDTYNYKIGRKIALYRAMVNAGIEKKTYTKIGKVRVDFNLEFLHNSPVSYIKEALINGILEIPDQEFRSALRNLDTVSSEEVFIEDVFEGLE